MKSIIILIGCILQACFISVELRGRYLPAVLLKGSASLFFVILGFLCSDGGSFAAWILAGLILGMAGDILLNLRYLVGEQGQKVFLIGILVFMLGHIMYLAALLKIAPSPVIPVGIGLLLSAILLYRILTTVQAKKAFKIFGVFYVGAVTLMAVVAVWNFMKCGGQANLMFAVGGVLFLISDVILIFNTFTGTSTPGKRILNLSLYYAGQILIAGSLMFI